MTTKIGPHLRAIWMRVLAAVVCSLWAAQAVSFPTAGYLPLADGNSWTYRLNGGPATEFWSVQPGTVTINGTPTKAISSGPSGAAYYTNDASGIRRHGSFDPALYVEGYGTVPYTETYAPAITIVAANANVGQIFNSNGMVTLDYGPLGAWPLAYNANSSIAGFETVSVPAGTATALKVVLSISASGYIGPTFVSMAITDTFWVVDGLGLLKDSTYDGTTTDVLELLSSSLLDTTPAALDFQPAGNASPGALVASNAVTVTGINIGAPVSVSGGEYSVNGGAFVTAPGTVNVGDTVVVRRTAPAIAGTTASAALTVGALTKKFFVSTASPPGVNALFFISTPGDYIGQGDVKGYSAATIGFSAQVQTARTEMYVSGNGNADWWYLFLYPPTGSALGTGLYENAQRFGGVGYPGLDFSGNGRGCNQIAGHFYVHEYQVLGGVLQLLAANFEQRCEGTGPPLFGQIRYGPTTTPVDQTGKSAFPLGFGAVSGAQPGSQVVSATRTLHGLAFPATISISGGEYSVNGAAFTALPGSVSNGQTLQVRASAPGAGQTAQVVLTVGNGSHLFSATSAGKVRSDFNGDGKSDIVWRNAGTGDNYLYPMNGLTVGAGQGYLRSVPDPWVITGVGDFDGDGKADLLWRNTSTGDTYLFLMNGMSVVGEAYGRNVPTDWAVVGVGDLNGDGKADIVWRNATSGDNYVYFMNGLAIGTEGYLPNVPSPWTIATIGDFDGDGKSDLFWRNTSSGDTYFFLMNGLAIASQGYGRNVPTDWAVLGAGDYDGDGKADLVWRNATSGDNYLFLLNGMGLAGEGYLRNVPAPWTIVGTGDYDGDGKADILWRNTSTGDDYLFLMNGLNVTGESYLPSVPTNWAVVK